MSFQVAEDSVKWLLKNCEIYEQIFNQKKNPTIFFFGGEPTLMWEEIIEPLVLKYPNINYSITTNGFALDNNRIDFLSKNNFSVLLSMDGEEYTQNYNRKNNSFNKLDQTIPYLLEKVKTVNFRGTIIPDTCEHTFQNIQYAQLKGFKKCFFTIDIFSHWDESSKEKLEFELKKYTLAYINSFVNKKDLINFTPFTNMITMILKQQMGLLDNIANEYKCGLGNGYGSIDFKGDIFTCQEILTNDNYNNKFKIGNIYTDIDFNSLKNLRDEYVNEKPVINEISPNKCIDCPLKFCCKKKTCQANNILCTNNCLIQSDNQCWWNLLLYRCALLSISILQDLPNFQEYMKQIILNEKEV